ncbi:hypothetical protein THAOC_26312 [Thalassiosira oceanica]|uniref:ATP-grasp domain-containing protein n=1 Tax=Thalassiosira oceanica TaxID=159749 RepID=K0S5H4_THAOC|nr:hypothetical protein THAOC_26312 [Thalassiosira oceanica]|eukprot:EJK54127.1 hypothetical protein THAOC_26312 [Thalassiosira oceanica]
MNGPPRNRHIAETVLVPQSAMDVPPLSPRSSGDSVSTDEPSLDLTSVSADEPSVDLTAAHEALIGDGFRNPANVIKQPTLATLGETPFDSGGDDIEHHRVIATEIVKDPFQFDSPEPVLQNAIVLLDPKIPDCNHLVKSGLKRGLMVVGVVRSNLNQGTAGGALYPTAEALLEVGMHQVYEPPVGAKFDVVECAANLKTIESQQNLRFLGVVPCREAAVDFSDILGALLGLTVVNDLGLASARRDKGLMKVAVANAGLRVARYARLTAGNGKDVAQAVEELELDYPVVVKTPRGMSTMDVFICDNEEDAVQASSKIVRSIGPDGRKTQYALLEEFIGGEEFAVNLIASPTTPRGVQVTDIWMYHKIQTDGAMVNTYQEMLDPHDRAYASLVRYAEGVARAVGVKYGVAHCEVKAKYDSKSGRWVDPVMIEIAGRLPGGRKSILAEHCVPGWHPFEAMVDAHCGFPVRVPPSFSPTKKAVQCYVPSDRSGVLKSMRGEDFDRLGTHHAHLLLQKVGEPITRATDLNSFAAHVWLVGEDAEEVRRDVMRARDEFRVEVE